MDTCLLIFPAKAKYGGNDNLREVSTKVRIQHLPKKIYGKMLDAARVYHLDNAVRSVVRTLKGKR